MSPILGIFASQGRVASNSYESISTVSVGSGGSSTITFSSIPSTYKHLQVRLITRNNRGSTLDGLYMRLNSDSGNNYSDHFIRGDGGSTTPATNATTSTNLMLMGTVPASNGTANIFAGAVIDVLEYANTNINKTVRSFLGYDASGTGYIGLYSGNWRSTSAITSITIGSTNGSGLLQYSQFALYGIKG